MHFSVHTLSVRTWGAELSVHIDVYGLVPLLCGHHQRRCSNGEESVGLITGIYCEDWLPVLRIQGSMAWRPNTCAGVNGMSRCVTTQHCCPILNKDWLFKPYQRFWCLTRKLCIHLYLLVWRHQEAAGRLCHLIVPGNHKTACGCGLQHHTIARKAMTRQRTPSRSLSSYLPWQRKVFLRICWRFVVQRAPLGSSLQ